MAQVPLGQAAQQLGVSLTALKKVIAALESAICFAQAPNDLQVTVAR